MSPGQYYNTVSKPFLLVDLQLEREGVLALDDLLESLRKRKGEILPLIAPPVRKKGMDNAIL